MGKRHMKAIAIKPRSSQQSVGPSSNYSIVLRMRAKMRSPIDIARGEIIIEANMVRMVSKRRAENSKIDSPSRFGRKGLPT